MTRRLADALTRGSNNFDIVRLIAAIGVIYGHSFMTQRIPGVRDPFGIFTAREYVPSMSVYAFFLISGIFVTMSVERNSPLRFIASRVLRIWPAVIAYAMVTAFVLGPAVSSLSVKEYFATSQAVEWMAQTSALIIGIPPYLPGLFGGNHTEFVNIALWTVAIEIKCYMLLLIFSAARLLSGIKRTVFTLAVAFAVFWYFTRHVPQNIFWDDFFKKQGGYKFYPVPFFMLGVLMYKLRARIAFNGKVALLLLSAFLLTIDNFIVGTALFYIAFVYGVMWLGTTPILSKIRPANDYSYGVYVYGFTVQQCVDHYAPSLTPYQSVFVSVPIALIAGALSWHLIEKPSLSLVGRVANLFGHSARANGITRSEPHATAEELR
jgi:peptidoglycan/LPS O-acetylase OafA/YrhL